jgi:purine-binding chemotaxis protein CheW
VSTTIDATDTGALVYEFADAQSVRDAARRRAGVLDLLVFRIGRERFGVGLAAVDEVVEFPVVKPMPQSPATMLGVAELRETLLSVHTPAAALGLALDDPRAMIVARARDGRRMGLAVDEAEGVMAFDFEALATTHASGLVLGVSSRGNLLAVVDIEALVETL